MDKNMQEKQERFVEKTDGNGNTYMVPNPEYYDADNRPKKFRKKLTNRTPKKKKRKK